MRRKFWANIDASCFCSVPATVADIFRYFLQVLSRKCFRRIRDGKRVRVLLISGRFGTLASRRPVANDKGERRIFRASSRFECRDLDKGRGCQGTFRRSFALGNALPRPISIQARANSILISISLGRRVLSALFSPERVNRHRSPRRVLALSFSFPFSTLPFTTHRLQRFSVEIGREKGKRKGRKEETGGRVDAKILLRSWK